MRKTTLLGAKPFEDCGSYASSVKVRIKAIENNARFTNGARDAAWKFNLIT